MLCIVIVKLQSEVVQMKNFYIINIESTFFLYYVYLHISWFQLWMYSEK